MSLHNLANDRRPQADAASQAMAYKGVVLAAPATVNDLLRVSIPGIDNVTEHEARWEPRVTAGGLVSMPAVGDLALVHFDNDGDAWVSPFWKTTNT